MKKVSEIVELSNFCLGCRRGIKNEVYCSFCKKYFDKVIDPKILNKLEYRTCWEHIIYLLDKYQQLHFRDITSMSIYNWNLVLKVTTDLVYSGIIFKAIPKHYLYECSFRLVQQEVGL